MASINTSIQVTLTNGNGAYDIESNDIITIATAPSGSGSSILYNNGGPAPITIIVDEVAATLASEVASMLTLTDLATGATFYLSAMTVNSVTTSGTGAVLTCFTGAPAPTSFTVTESRSSIRTAMNALNPDPLGVYVDLSSAQTITGVKQFHNTSATALAVGPNGSTNPVFNVDASTASAATGVKVKGAAAAAGVAISVTSSGTDENLTVDAKGAGSITLNATATGPVVFGRSTIGKHATFAVNTSATVSAANFVKGYFTSTSVAGVTLTLDTATNIATALGAVQGTVFDFYVDNTAGASTVTVAVATGVVAATPIITGGDTLTVANSATQGIGVFKLVFSSATTAVLYRIG